MANETVTLLRYAKLPGLGWRPGQAILGKNGEVSPDHMLLGKRKNKRKVHAPDGHFELRYFDARSPSSAALRRILNRLAKSWDRASFRTCSNSSSIESSSGKCSM